ncbi:MAG: peroxidase-related enzyme [Bacteroidota bacterium]
MTWIKTILYKNARPALKKAYDKIKGPNNYIDNVFLAHSLRPKTLLAHISLYKNTIHNPNNSLPKWYLEGIGVYVSYLNGCNYCMTHHNEGFKRLYPHPEKADRYLTAVKAGAFNTFFDDKHLLGLDYAKRLTLNMNTVTEGHINTLKEVGFSDGEILELNQVVGYFNYGNRTVIGLGVNLDGDILGQ